MLPSLALSILISALAVNGQTTEADNPEPTATEEESPNSTVGAAVVATHTIAVGAVRRVFNF